MTSSATIALSAINVGIALSGLVIYYRFGSGKQEQRALSVIFLLFIGISSLPITLELGRLLYFFHLASLLPILLAIPPALYFYVLAKTSFGANFKFHWLNSVLPCIGLATMIGYFLLPHRSKVEMFVKGELPEGLLPLVLAISTFALIMVWSLTSVCYLVLIIKRLRLYRATLKQCLSNIDSIELRWVEWLMIFLVILWLSSALLLVGENLSLPPNFSTDTLYVLLAGMLLFLIAFVSVPDFKSNDNLVDRTNDFEEACKIVTQEKYSKSSLSESQAEEIAMKLEELMRSEEVYLDADLSLAKLSELLDAPANFVSQAINDILNSTFYDYVSQWRIKESKKQLRLTDRSITNVYLEAGFNSRSTFYKAFKIETGVTPKQYREQAKTAPIT